MGLDYAHTCPDIDNAIKVYQEYIVDTLKDFIGELNPYLDLENDDVKKIITEHKNYLYGNFENAFEDVRKSNEDMREDADIQIDNAIDDLNNANDEVKELHSTIEKLQNRINELEIDVTGNS